MSKETSKIISVICALGVVVLTIVLIVETINLPKKAVATGWEAAANTESNGAAPTAPAATSEQPEAAAPTADTEEATEPTAKVPLPPEVAASPEAISPEEASYLVIAVVPPEGDSSNVANPPDRADPPVENNPPANNPPVETDPPVKTDPPTGNNPPDNNTPATPNPPAKNNLPAENNTPTTPNTPAENNTPSTPTTPSTPNPPVSNTPTAPNNPVTPNPPAAAKNAGYAAWLEAQPEKKGSEEAFVAWVKANLNKGDAGEPNTVIQIEEKIVEKIVEKDTAYEFWLAQGNAGSHTDFLAWIQDMTEKQYEVIETDDSIFADVTFDSRVIEYDGNEHALTAQNVPADTEIYYADNTGTDVGSYRGFVLLRKGTEFKVMSAELTITKINITQAQFDDQRVTYDGSVKSISVVGAPDNATVEYTMNSEPFEGAIEVGTYDVTATITGDNYITYTDTATLVIEKADLKGITFKDVEITYDGKSHSILISGNRPDGVGLEYFMNNAPFTSASDAGTYPIAAKLTGGKNYNDLTLTANLIINKAEISGITLNSYSTTYDGNPKYIEILGKLPDGASVAYTHKQSGAPFTGATTFGTHTVVATITGNNYHTKTLEATITIRAMQLAQPTGLNLTLEKNSKGIVRAANLTWEAVPNAATYHVNVYYKTTGELATIVYPNTSEGTTEMTTNRTCDLMHAIWNELPADNYTLKVVAVPAEFDTSYAQSEPSVEFKEYTHAGILRTPKVWIDSEKNQLRWDAVATFDPHFKYTIYDVRVIFYDKEGNPTSSKLSPQAYLGTSVGLDELKKDLEITTGTCRFQMRSVANAALSAYAVNASTMSDYSDLTELFVFE